MGVHRGEPQIYKKYKEIQKLTGAGKGGLAKARQYVYRLVILIKPL